MVGTNLAIKLDSFGRGTRIERSEGALAYRVQNDTLFQKRMRSGPQEKKISQSLAKHTRNDSTQEPV